MIWLFCKKKINNKKKQQKHKLLTGFFQHKKKFLLCFYGTNEKAWEERGGASWARHKRNTERWARLCPSNPPTRKKTQSVWLAAQSRGSKGERKGLFCAFHPSGAQTRIRTPIQPHQHMLTQTHIHTHMHARTLVSAWRWLWPLSLCSANQKTALNPGRVSHRWGAAVETLTGPSAPLSCTKTSYG